MVYFYTINLTHIQMVMTAQYKMELTQKLENVYGKKVTNLEIHEHYRLCTIDVTFEDGLEGYYEQQDIYLSGWIEVDGKEIPENRGTQQQEEVRAILIDCVDIDEDLLLEEEDEEEED